MNYRTRDMISPNPQKSSQSQSRSTTNVMMKLQEKLCDITFFHGHRLLQRNGKQNKPIPAPMGARSSANAFCAGVSVDCPESAILECGGLQNMS